MGLNKFKSLSLLIIFCLAIDVIFYGCSGNDISGTGNESTNIRPKEKAVKIRFAYNWTDGDTKSSVF